MNRYLRSPHKYLFRDGIWGYFFALVCVLTLAGCGGDEDKSVTNISEASSAALNVQVNPASAVVVVTGPDSFSQTFTGNQILTDLTPGSYSANASATGYVTSLASINVVESHTSNLSFTLVAEGISEPGSNAALSIQVNPASTTVVVTGPESYTLAFTGNQILTSLAPGEYTANASAPGFVSSTATINVVDSHTSNLSFSLIADAILSDVPRAVYRNEQGNLIALDEESLQSGEFVFYAWLRDESFGIFPENAIATPPSDPFDPLLDEQMETAPSLTQNLADAWVGFRDSSGVIRPVIGADVRWEIDQQYSGRIGSMQFGTSDDNRIASGYGVFDDQADTRTNNSRLTVERFPQIATQFPLYNQSGIDSPYVDGFTWVTLFSPDATASARIVVVATLNGDEIGKQILYKNFAPAPNLLITKTVDQDIVNLGAGGTGTVTWTVTVSNTGLGDATNVDLSDTLASGAAASYTIGALPAGTTAAGEGFTGSFALSAPGTIAPPLAPQILGVANDFAVLASTSVTNTGSSVITGEVGVSAGSAATGFPPGVVQSGTIHTNDSQAVAAQIAVTAAFATLGDMSTLPCTAPVDTPITGVLLPGVYCYSSSVATDTAITLDAQGDPEATFIFRTGSTLTSPTGTTLSLINGADPCNVYWTVGTSATLGDANFFVGNILAQTSIDVGTGTNISGRLFARDGEVILDSNSVTAPTSCGVSVPPSSTQTYTFDATVTDPGTYCNLATIPSYNSATVSFTPADLSAQACFTAVEPVLSIVKDFVAADNTTSLGHSMTVAANEHAKLRVRVINSGTGLATDVSVSDIFDAAAPTNTGLIGDYQILNVSSGTLNDADSNGSSDGFDTVIGDLAVDASVTLLFTVTSAVDGVYCDEASVLDSTGPVGSDTACLTVATPNLVITKDDAPASVLPGSTYTSTIVVGNTGTASAANVVISDLLGLNAAINVRAVYVSSSLNGAAGTLASNTVTASPVTIPANGSVTFTVVSRIALGALSGTYCDTATVTSSNAATKEAIDCIDVPAFSALQTQLIDAEDPIAVGSNVTFFSTLYVEDLSNEGVTSSVLRYSFGLNSPLNIGDPGSFRVVSTKIFIDSNPVRDPVTGTIASDTSSPTAVQQIEGTDFTIDNSVPGYQVITMAPTVAMQPNSARYIVHETLIPVGTPTNRLYTTSYIWDSVGLVDPANTYQTSSSEATTVLP